MLNVVDLFSGVGGLSYGFAKNKNFNVVLANEILPDMAKAYTLNHKNVKMYNEDIVNVSAKRIKEDLGNVQIDLIVGGPPCQAFSTVGKRLLNDPRAQLFREYFRLLEELNPKAFIFENVKGILSFNGGKLIKEIVESFENLGYHVKYETLDASTYGVPQIRKRVIIVGSKFGNDFEYPKQTHGPDLKSLLTLSDAIGDLPEIGNGQSTTKYISGPKNEYQKLMRGKCKTLWDHESANNNDNLIKLMDALPDGGSPKDIDKLLRPKSGFGNTYCRLWWNKPCTTITGSFGTPSSSRCIHPKVPRALTTREGARVQSFPDNYKFYGSRSSKNLQIGNAVPPQLSHHLAKAIIEHFKKHMVKQYE